MKRSLILAVIASILTLCLIIGCAGLATKKEKADVAFNETYLDYQDKRPGIQHVVLNPEILSLIPNMNEEKIKDINQKVKYLSMIYNLSTIYTDMYFSNAEFENYKINKSNEWKKGVKSGKFCGFKDYEEFISNCRKDTEFISIQNRMIEAKDKYIRRSKELGKDMIIEALKKYLNVKEVMAIKPKPGMSILEKGKFLKALKNEAKTIEIILLQGVYTGIGTGLVVAQATTTITLATIEVAGKVVKVTIKVTAETGRVIIVAVNEVGETIMLGAEEFAQFVEESIEPIGPGLQIMLADALSSEGRSFDTGRLSKELPVIAL